MPLQIIRYSVLEIILLIIQVLIASHIMLFGVAMPIIFVYLLIRLPLDMNVKWVLTLAFLLGLIVDIFSDTPGVNALSCTILAILRIPVARLYTGNDETMTHVIPCMSTLGIPVYAKYLFTLILIYCVLSFSLEYFTLAYLGRMTVKILASATLSFFIMLGIDGLMRNKAKN